MQYLKQMNEKKRQKKLHKADSLLKFDPLSNPTVKNIEKKRN